MKLITRFILQELESHLTKKEITLLVGPRQVGKTTLMKILEEKLKNANKNTLYLNLDSESDKKFFSSQESLINKIRLELGSKKGFVFIDEIQRKEDAGVFLKGIYDMGFSYKFIVSGSGSIELKEKIYESLAGRKRIFTIEPISFEEFVDFKTGYKYVSKKNKFFELEKDKTKYLLEEYLNFGGFPRVILEERLKDKQLVIDDILHSYLEKDISSLLNVEKISAFGEMIRLCASRIGQLVNYSNLAGILNISVRTLKNYLWYAEKTFVLKRIEPFFRNFRKEISKMPTIYFYDLGLRNYVLGLFGNIFASENMGLVFENFVLNILVNRIQFSGGKINFWRSKDKAEVDFVINFGEEVIPVEVKYKVRRNFSVGKSLFSFINKYKPKKAYIVGIDGYKKISVKETEVTFLPFWRMKDIGWIG